LAAAARRRGVAWLSLMPYFAGAEAEGGAGGGPRAGVAGGQANDGAEMHTPRLALAGAGERARRGAAARANAPPRDAAARAGGGARERAKLGREPRRAERAGAAARRGGREELAWLAATERARAGEQGRAPRAPRFWDEVEPLLGGHGGGASADARAAVFVV